jgi:hypothetical protein
VSKDSFPLRIVEQLNTENGTWRGRRGAGTVVARGIYRFGQNDLAKMQVIVFDDSDDRVSATAQVCENALKLMFSCLKGDSSFRDILERMAGCELSVDFMEDHEYLIELDSSAAVLSVACDVAIPLGYSHAQYRGELPTSKTEDQQGFEYLLVLGHCHLLLCRQGWTQRQALARVVDLYASFSTAERACLHRVLEGSILDSGNLFSIFLKRAAFDSCIGSKNHQQAVGI